MTERPQMSDRAKIDLQLSEAEQNEIRLAKIFDGEFQIQKIELKSETWQWEQTGNICIEYEYNGKPSGIAKDGTKADVWVHELKRDGETLVYLMFPIERLRALCREAFKQGNHRTAAGDGGKSKVVLLALKDILK
jgi:hypothetical protein